MSTLGQIAAPSGSSGLTDAQLRANPVPVSGTVAVTDVATETTLSALNTKVPAQGQALAAASTPVVLTAAQVVTLTPPAAITGFNLEATQALVQAKTDNLDVLLSTRLKPADTLAGVTTVQAVTAITNALPTGANVIGGVNIAPAQTLATVTTLSGTTTLTPGTGATNLGKAEDAAHTTGDVGVLALGVRQDVRTTTPTSADGDYGALIVNSRGELLVETRGASGSWAIQHQPAVATQATIVRSSAGAGIRNVCTSITISISSTAAPTAGSVIFNLLDGATILWSCRLSIPAVAGNSQSLSLGSLWIEGTAATSMTLQTSAATPGATFGTVALTGTTTT